MPKNSISVSKDGRSSAPQAGRASAPRLTRPLKTTTAAQRKQWLANLRLVLAKHPPPSSKKSLELSAVRSGRVVSKKLVQTSTSRLQARLEQQMRSAGIHFTGEYRFHPIRRWRFDMAVVSKKLGIEVDGGVWSGGRHTRGAGFTADCEKFNEAMLTGWRVLRVTKLHIDNGQALAWIERAMT